MCRTILVSTLLFTLAACVNIGYQPFNVMSGGYKDSPLDNGNHSVSYEMYGQADPEVVLERWHMRAAELCPSGYEVIELERKNISTNSAVASGGVFVPLSSSDPRYVGQISCKE